MVEIIYGCSEGYNYDEIVSGCLERTCYLSVRGEDNALTQTCFRSFPYGLTQ